MYKLLVLSCLLAVTLGARLPKNIKKVSAAKIIGGTEIPIEDSPYTVQLNINDHFSQGGVIVNKKHILTNAYWIYYFKAEDMSVRAGSATLNAGGTLHNVTKIVYHPDYNINYKNNIAILTVDPPFKFDKTTKKIALATEEVLDGKMGTATGWGSTTSFDWVFPDKLYSVDMRVISNENCDVATETEFCAGERSYTSCVGDEGGPIVVHGVLAGISSHPWQCGDLVPTTFTSVVDLKDFILKNI